MEKGDGDSERPGGAGAHCGAQKEPGRAQRHGSQQGGEQRDRMLRERGEAKGRGCGRPSLEVLAEEAQRLQALL